MGVREEEEEEVKKSGGGGEKRRARRVNWVWVRGASWWELQSLLLEGRPEVRSTYGRAEVRRNGTCAGRWLLDSESSALRNHREREIGGRESAYLWHLPSTASDDKFNVEFNVSVENMSTHGRQTRWGKYTIHFSHIPSTAQKIAPTGPKFTGSLDLLRTASHLATGRRIGPICMYRSLSWISSEDPCAEISRYWWSISREFGYDIARSARES